MAQSKVCTPLCSGCLQSETLLLGRKFLFYLQFGLFPSWRDKLQSKATESEPTQPSGESFEAARAMGSGAVQLAAGGARGLPSSSASASLGLSPSQIWSACSFLMTVSLPRHLLSCSRRLERHKGRVHHVLGVCAAIQFLPCVPCSASSPQGPGPSSFQRQKASGRSVGVPKGGFPSRLLLALALGSGCPDVSVSRPLDLP